MNTLRWIVAGLLGMGAIGWLLLAFLGAGFRRSWGASAAHPAIVFLPPALLGLLLVAVLLWRPGGLPFGARRPLTPAELAYPVLLVEDDHILEVCLDAAELTLRPENTDHVIEQRFRVIDSQGRRYRIGKYRSVEPRPSFLRRYLTASVNPTRRFRVDFELQAEAELDRAQVMVILRNREWQETGAEDPSADLASQFRAYRLARYREFGQPRDRLPEPESTPAPGPIKPPGR